MSDKRLARQSDCDYARALARELSEALKALRRADLKALSDLRPLAELEKWADLARRSLEYFAAHGTFSGESSEERHALRRAQMRSHYSKLREAGGADQTAYDDCLEVFKCDERTANKALRDLREYFGGLSSK